MRRSTQMRAFVVAFLIAASAAGTAGAQEIGAGRGRHYRGAVLNAIAAATANSSSVIQEGAGNAAGISQSGSANTAGIRQYGRGNAAVIAQTGTNNTACLIQVGRGLEGSIVQNGDNQSTGLVQTRRGTREIPPELCSIDASGRGVVLGVMIGRRVRQSR